MTYTTISIQAVGEEAHWLVLDPEGKPVRFTEDQAEAVSALLNERGAAFPEWLDPTERKIISKLLDTILADPTLEIEVHDEEEVVIAPTRDRAAIERDTAQTGYTYYVVFRKEYGRLGFIWLIHGNGAAVISDYADKPEIEALVRPASELAETL